MALSYKKTGYLNDEYRIFYLNNSEKKTIAYHYHDFHKLLLFFQGNVSYIIEGKQYDLENGDIVLVPAGEIHRPLIHDESPYERMIFYISTAFFERYQEEGYDLFRCFAQASESGVHLIRQESRKTKFFDTAADLAGSFQNPPYCSGLYRQSKFLEMMTLLGGMLQDDQLQYAAPLTANPTVQRILQYINEHLTEDTLNIDRIAEAVFLNRSYLMHLFRQETGYTVGNYITDKRLFFARGLIRKGFSVTDACYEAGFRNYSSFYYAYRKKYRNTQELINQ